MNRTIATAVMLACLACLTMACLACGGASTLEKAQQTSPSSSASEAAAESPRVNSSSPSTAEVVASFLDAPLTVARGSNATLDVRTAPNTSCTIEVDYKSGPSTAAGLVPKTSDSSGNVSWTWKVGANTTPGTWPITVACGGTSAQTSIKVT